MPEELETNPFLQTGPEDSPGVSINMPVTKNELEYIEIAVRTYRKMIDNSKQDDLRAFRQSMVKDLTKLVDKIESNLISLDDVQRSEDSKKKIGS